MRYNAKSLEINVVISGKVLIFKDIKISLGLLITAREMHALFLENHFLKVSTTANNRMTNINIINSPCKSSGCRWGFILFFFVFCSR